jgi:hypothetical protein
LAKTAALEIRKAIKEARSEVEKCAWTSKDPIVKNLALDIGLSHGSF